MYPLQPAWRCNPCRYHLRKYRNTDRCSLTYKLRGSSKWLAPLPPIVANTVIVPFVLYYGYGVNLPIPLMMLTVGAGEVISCGIFGMIVLTALSKVKGSVFGKASYSK